jgi:cytochrome o ubiquinol oxidase subunit II
MSGSGRDDRSRHASAVGDDLYRGSGHESGQAGRCSWKTHLLSHTFHGSTVTPHGCTARGHRAGARASLAVAVFASALSSCQSGVLDPQGPVGAAQRVILINALAIMLVIVVPTILATLGFSWWFRASNTRARYLPDWAYSGRIELVVWSIPLLVIMFLGGIAWIGSHDLDPAKPLEAKTEPLRVQVVSLDWKWLFIYPDQGIASLNQLVVPARTPIHFTLTSASVMNAFFIPQLGSMIYTMNGMTTQLHLQADREGVFHGLSSHFSGDGFPGMHFQVRAVGAQAFDRWVADARNSTVALDRLSYDALAKQSLNMASTTYRGVDPQLFKDIVSQTIPAGPGPQIGKPTPAVSPRTGG